MHKDARDHMQGQEASVFILLCRFQQGYIPIIQSREIFYPNVDSLVSLI